MTINETINMYMFSTKINYTRVVVSLHLRDWFTVCPLFAFVQGGKIILKKYVQKVIMILITATPSSTVPAPPTSSRSPSRPARSVQKLPERLKLRRT